MSTTTSTTTALDPSALDLDELLQQALAAALQTLVTLAKDLTNPKQARLAAADILRFAARHKPAAPKPAPKLARRKSERVSRPPARREGYREHMDQLIEELSYGRGRSYEFPPIKDKPYVDRARPAATQDDLGSDAGNADAAAEHAFEHDDISTVSLVSRAAAGSEPRSCDTPPLPGRSPLPPRATPFPP